MTILRWALVALANVSGFCYFWAYYNWQIAIAIALACWLVTTLVDS